MAFRGKNIADLTEADLLSLIQEKFEERDTIEYKREMWGAGDEDKREMLRDISSMANAVGGHILVGIEASADGVPTGISGIDSANQIERIINSSRDSIDKRIVGLQVVSVPLANGKAVLVVAIPPSRNAPHMITFKGLNQFWKRHGNLKGRMSVDEIAEAFDRRASGLNRVQRFGFLRRNRVLESIGDETYTLMSATPLFLVDEAILDVNDADLRKLLLSPPHIAPGYGISCGYPYRTIDGLRADQHTPYTTSRVKSPSAYMEVFSNGYLEYGRKIKDGQQGKYLAGIADIAPIVDFIELVAAMYGRYLPNTPLVVNVSVLNAQGIWLAASDYRDDDRLVTWQEQNLDLGELYVEDLATESHTLAKRICDRLWQAFNRESCNLFDNAGKFLPKNR